MAFTPNTNFQKTFSRGDIEPVIKMEIEVRARHFIRVKDYSVGGTDTIQIAYDHLAGTTTVTMTEGTEFSASGSNAITAQDIRDAINEHSSLRGVVLARIDDVDNTKVEIIVIRSRPYNHTIRVSISDTNFADVEIPRVPNAKQAVDVASFTGSGETVTVTVKTNAGVTTAYTFLAGTDFTYSTTNKDTTAANLADAINSHGTLGTLTQSWSTGRRVWVMATSYTVMNLTITSTDEADFDTIETPLYFFTYVSGTRNLFGYQPSISKYDPPDRAIDAATRALSVGEAQAEFVDDGNLRHVFKRYVMKGARVLIYWGTPSLQEADFVRATPMIVDEILPDSAGRITMTLIDALGLLRDIPLKLRFGGQHPLEAMQDVLDNALSDGSSTSTTFATDWFDYTTLDPSLYTDRSHFVVSRTNTSHTNLDSSEVSFEVDARMTDEQPALDMLNELLLCADGTLYATTGGKFAYKTFSVDAAANHTWAIGPDTGYDATVIHQTTSLDSLCSDVSVAQGRDKDGNQVITSLTNRDAVEAARFLYKISMEGPWLNGTGTVYTLGTIGPSNTGVDRYRIYTNTTSFQVPHATRTGFCGSVGWSAGTRPSWREANGSTRPVFLRLEGTKSNGTTTPNYEVVAIDEVSYTTQDSETAISAPSDASDITMRLFFATGYANSALGFTGADNGRSGFDSSAPAEWGVASAGSFVYRNIYVTDITIAVFLLQNRLRRFKFGAPKLTLKTNFSKFGVDLGDIVVLTGDDQFLAFQMDGLNSNVFWEVTRITEKPWDDSPGIELELTFLRREEEVSVIDYVFVPGDGGYFPEDGAVATNELIDNSGNDVYIDIDSDTVPDTPVVDG